LILDYGRNIERHGCLDALRPPGERKGSGGPLAKTCPKCQALLPLPIMTCPECGHQFERKDPKPKIDHTASDASVLSGEVTRETYDVLRTEYQVWEKRGAPPGHPKTVRVTYVIDLMTSFSEWLCPEHSGYARKKFEKWWKKHAIEEAPLAVSAHDVCEADFMGILKEVKKITVKRVSGERYPEVESCELGPSNIEKRVAESKEEEWEDLPF
jgi:DNA repair protein RadD